MKTIIVFLYLVCFFLPVHAFSQDTIITKKYIAIYQVKPNPHKCVHTVFKVFFTDLQHKPYNALHTDTSGYVGSKNMEIKFTPIVKGRIDGRVVQLNGNGDTLFVEVFKKGVLKKKLRYEAFLSEYMSPSPDNLLEQEEVFNKKGELVKDTFFRENKLRQPEEVEYYKNCKIKKTVEYLYDGDKLTGKRRHKKSRA